MNIQIKNCDLLDQRFNIAFFATFVSLIAFIFSGNEIIDLLVTYIILATLFDQVSQFIKPVPINKKELRRKHKMMPAQLELYVASKRHYRLLAVGVASIIGIVFFLLGYEFSMSFVLTNIVVWCFYPIIRKLKLGIPAPKMFHRLTDEEREELERRCMNTFADRASDPLTPGTIGWCSNRMQEFNSLNSHSKNLH